MNAICFRCDWQGDTKATSCPSCGAPLYRPAPRERERRAAPTPGAGPSPAGERARSGPRSGSTDDAERPPSETRGSTTSVRSVYVLVGIVFSVIVFLLVRGGPEEEPAGGTDTPRSRATGGILVYTVPDGNGAARLWRWDLITDRAVRGPLIREPLAMTTVRSTRSGWLGFTSDLGNGVFEASVLDSLDVDARVEPVGRADIVTWIRQGASVVLIDRGPILDSCRREVRVTSVTVGSPASDVILHDTICGDILSAGRTSLGYFVTRQGLKGVDVVGAGYADAGVLLRDHGVIGISPGGEMLVTPSTEFLPAIVPTRPSRGGYDPPPLRVAGAAEHFAQFGGRPVPYLVRGISLRVDRVLAYDPAAQIALVVGRVGGELPGLWELPLVPLEGGTAPPRLVGSVGGITAAAYANDGTAYVVTNGWLYRLRDHVLKRIDVPSGAPTPTGPLAWIVREPVSEL